MKNLKIYTFIALIVAAGSTIIFSSCNDNYLQEVPKGFLSPENTFVNKAGFETGVTDLYRLSRTIVTSDVVQGMLTTEVDKSMTALYGAGTDLGWYWDKKLFYGDYSAVNSNDVTSQNYWIKLFAIIKGANILITRSDASNAKWNSDNDKFLIQAEAKFFRALAYRYLVFLYGDVPLVKEEITSPKLDFIRSPKSDVLNFIVEDLEFATKYLPIPNTKNGSLSKAAADQLLAEIYLAKGDFDKSIAAASRIISDSQYHLMTTRFGTMTDKPGDVFYDLFVYGNQNNAANKEAILVWQIEYNVPGGMAINKLERAWGPYIEQLKAPDGQAALLKDTYLGRPIGFMRPSVYLEYTIWSSDWNNDIRNSAYNMKRSWIINNPISKNFGQQYIPKAADSTRNLFVWIQKAAMLYGHPQGYDTNGQIYTDIYAMRLSETYLLRAEAYLGKGDKTSAAADINVVRNRAKATPVDPSNVTIDYILDERARELVVEEPRRLTLARLGILDVRVKKYNPTSASTIQPFHNLWPIPQTEIDANIGAKLTQNPGY